MSIVTNVVLVTGSDERAVARVNAWVTLEHGFHPLIKVSGAWQWGKAMECEVWTGAFNYLGVASFVAACKAAPWEWPAHLVVVTQDGEIEAYDLAGGA